MNREETEKFLLRLAGPNATFTFQTFDDSERKRGRLNAIMNGAFEDKVANLASLNAEGAGVFVTVNETDLRGRTAANVRRVRAVFVDLDGSPLEPILEWDKKPHIIVESSPGRWHAYWVIDDMALQDFEPAQRALAARFAGDPKVHDLPRVMRLPGFAHQKGEPFVTRLEEVNDLPPYQASDFTVAKEEKKPARVNGHAGGDAGRLNDLALESLEEWVPHVFGAAAKLRNGVYRISSKHLGRELEEDLSISPKGIKDFGVHDVGDGREGKRSAIDVVMEHLGKTFDEAARWLRGRLGYGGVQLDDFWAYMPQHSYIYSPTGEPWPAVSVNSRIAPIPLTGPDGSPLMELDKKGEPTEKQKRLPASAWLDRHKPVEQMTWAPGEPQAIRDRLISDGGWSDRVGVTCFNQYRPPTIKRGDASQAATWIEHVRKVYPDDADHLMRYFAQRVQSPEVKPNHAVVLGGAPGIGKDTMLEPIKHAVGPWNFADITPQNLLGRFNSFVKSVILRVSEARDLEVNRYQFYEHMKNYAAGPPDVLRCDEKHLREHAVLNCCGVVITTNYKTDGIYLPADDRRHYVAWSDRKRDDFDDVYWNELWGWYKRGGFGHVAAYLATLDLSTFDPKAPPPKTPTFWAIVDANRAPEDSELEEILERLNKPPAVTIDEVSNRADVGFGEWLRDRKNRRAVPHRFEQCDYTPVRNDSSKDGLWKIRGRRQVVYGRDGLTVNEQLAAARQLTGETAQVGAPVGETEEIPYE